ncbi:hypothetical protein Val02_52200 [Virgisporangium aliadipatigenens]|uniref:Uncharacterized protein n=1 Tax=Virgisporangium aliadipatigenens TaxID=741659 RepID=A0A8J3YMN3_9ACTN|nr:hypothetical protein Val02_52200 [Virgisporangium aliadipatigenens]
MERYTSGAGEHVRCPICQDDVSWTQDEIYRWDRANLAYEPLDLNRIASPEKRIDTLRTAYRRCPNPSGDTDLEHYLPWLYPMQRPPLVIGLVGGSQTGKTHLVAAMIGEIIRGGLHRYGLRWAPLDQARHEAFTQDFVNPLMAGEKVARTNPGTRLEYVDALLVSGATGSWPVVFFDISGEDFREGSRPARFVLGAGALIFLADPGRALGVVGDSNAEEADRDTSFQATLNRITAVRPATRGFVDVPATIVVSKSDRLRFRYPADFWMRHESPGPEPDPDLIRAESRDVYALLHRQPNAQPWLEPAHVFRRCTLHFVSATGGEPAPQGNRYPRGVRPRRVLEPLVALFAMCGVLGGARAGEVGV